MTQSALCLSARAQTRRGQRHTFSALWLPGDKAAAAGDGLAQEPRADAKPGARPNMALDLGGGGGDNGERKEVKRELRDLSANLQLGATLQSLRYLYQPHLLISLLLPDVSTGGGGGASLLAPSVRKV